MLQRSKNIGLYSKKILDPVIRKKIGISLDLLKSWSEIVGHDIASLCRPIKILWVNDESLQRKKAILLLYAEAGVGIVIEHNKEKMLEIINSYFGYRAIHGFKITQTIKPAQQHLIDKLSNSEDKMLREYAKRFEAYQLSDVEIQKIEHATRKIQDQDLKDALLKLGSAIFKFKYLK